MLGVLQARWVEITASCRTIRTRCSSARRHRHRRLREHPPNLRRLGQRQDVLILLTSDPYRVISRPETASAGRGRAARNPARLWRSDPMPRQRRSDVLRQGNALATARASCWRKYRELVPDVASSPAMDWTAHRAGYGPPWANNPDGTPQVSTRSRMARASTALTPTTCCGSTRTRTS